jgi:hypothetical protein
MTDPMGIKIATAVLIEICKEAIKGVRELSAYLKTEVEQRDLLGNAIRQYTLHLAERFTGVKILGMSAPLPLEQIYTRVRVRDRLRKSQPWVGNLTQESFEQMKSRDVILQGIDVINNTQYVTILGQPGAGKTTFLRYILTQALQNNLRKPALPVFVSLNDISANEKVSIFAAIVNQFAVCFLSAAKPFVENLLRKGRCIILLDGLDEVSTSIRPDVIRDIKELSRLYPDNQLIVSCRVATYNHWFDTFSDFEVVDFSETDIEVFVNNWFVNEPHLATSCLGQLRSEPGIAMLASLPLFLVMICLAFEATKLVAPTRVELYRHAIDALLNRWDASRNIARDEPYKQLTQFRKLDLLSEIAAATFEEGEYYFRTERVTDIIGEFLKQLPGQADMDSDAVLDAIEGHHGLLVERAKRIHSFSHLTFQEFFTARSHMQAGPSAQILLIQELGEDPRWREVIILLASLVPSGDALMLALLRKLTATGYPQHINRILNDLEQTIKSLSVGGRRGRKFVTVIDLPVVPKLEEVARTIMERNASLDIDALLRGLGTKILAEFILSEGTKQRVKQGKGDITQYVEGNNEAKIFATAIIRETEALVSYGGGVRAQMALLLGMTGPYREIFRSHSWIEITLKRIAPLCAMQLIDVLPRQQAGELAASIGDNLECSIFSEHTEYLSNLIACSRLLFNDLGLEPLEDKQRDFAKRATQTLSRSGANTSSIRGWRQVYLSGIILDILSGQVTLRREVRKAALVILMT